jgi:hypothetical protein
VLPYSGQNNNPSQFINSEMYLMTFCACFNSRSKALCVSRPSRAGYISLPTHSKIYMDPVSGMSCGSPSFQLVIISDQSITVQLKEYTVSYIALYKMFGMRPILSQRALVKRSRV